MKRAAQHRPAFDAADDKKRELLGFGFRFAACDQFIRERLANQIIRFLARLIDARIRRRRFARDDRQRSALFECGSRSGLVRF